MLNQQVQISEQELRTQAIAQLKVVQKTMDQSLVVLGVWISRKVYPDDEEKLQGLKEDLQGMKAKVDSFFQRLEQ